MTEEPGAELAAAGSRLPFPEVAALFNPPLGAIVLAAAAIGHMEDAGSGLPWLASFLVTPFAFHDPTRLALPRGIATNLGAWIGEHRVLGDQFGRHAQVLAPTTRAAIRYALRSGMITLASATLTASGPVPGITGNRAADIREYYRAGRLAGRWLARTDVVTAYSILGVAL